MSEGVREIVVSLSAGLSIMLITMVIAEFFAYTSKVYKEKYITEAATELDDVLLNMPPGRILDLSLALAALTGFLAVTIFVLWSSSYTWPKAAFIALITGFPAFFAPRLYLRHKKQMRLAAFNAQLEDALQSMSSSLKAGFSINQALETIAHEHPRPISVEFRLLVQEIRLGVHIEKALQNMEDRMQSEDLELVSTAIITARQTGGNLTTIFERLASVIRERTRIKGKVRSLTAQGTLQAYIVGAMPFILLFAMNYVAPEMMSMFFDSMLGILLISLVVILVTLGILSIKKITKIDI